MKSSWKVGYIFILLPFKPEPILTPDPAPCPACVPLPSPLPVEVPFPFPLPPNLSLYLLKSSLLSLLLVLVPFEPVNTAFGLFSLAGFLFPDVFDPAPCNAGGLVLGAVDGVAAALSGTLFGGALLSAAFPIDELAFEPSPELSFTGTTGTGK